MKKFIAYFLPVLMFASSVDAATTAPSRVVASTPSSDVSSTTRGGATSARTVSRTVTTDNNSAASTSAASRASARTVAASVSGSSARDTNAATRINTATRSAAPQVATTSARANLDAAVSTVGRNARTAAASSAATDPAQRRAGVASRPTTTAVGGRAVIDASGTRTGSNIGKSVRSVQSRAAAATVSAESIAQAKERMQQTAELNKSCQEQYNDCMDQFCAVIDANQKRCSCSSNLEQYTKVEKAVKEANTQLNDVAQRIRYVGLSADEIRAIMTETEAEEALAGSVDTSETRSMLQDIEDLIKDPSTSSSSSSSGGGLDLDLDFDFSADTEDMFGLDFLNTNTTSSFSKLRGTELYKTAQKRCNTILNQCKDAGATSQQITANYELAIDKDCIAYEQGLTKMNETLVSNVRSAGRMLQKARLSVMQNKNQYDAKGCVAALNTCMADDMVCGEDYSKCLDPTKRFIDENGKVVLGQNITKITSFMEDFNNTDINKNTMGNSYNLTINAEVCAGSQYNDGSCMVKYLLTKIGTKQKVTEEGLCRAVLDKCQRYTYDDNGNYQPYNDIVVNYVQRAMVNIKSAQQKIISDYASSCMLDVANCYNQQVSQVNAWSTSASAASIQAVMRGACRNVALTCGFAIFDGPPSISSDGSPVQGCSYVKTNDCAGDDDTCINGAYIDCVSDMFYQSMLCPENSTYTYDPVPAADIGNNKPYVNNKCQCNSGYVAWGGNCVLTCATGEERNSSGVCVKKATETK